MDNNKYCHETYLNYLHLYFLYTVWSNHTLCYRLCFMFISLRISRLNSTFIPKTLNEYRGCFIEVSSTLVHDRPLTWKFELMQIRTKPKPITRPIGSSEYLNTILNISVGISTRFIWPLYEQLVFICFKKTMTFSVC